jgi:hypothetical protein
VERIIRNRKNACDEKGVENTCGWKKLKFVKKSDWRIGIGKFCFHAYLSILVFLYFIFVYSVILVLFVFTLIKEFHEIDYKLNTNGRKLKKWAEIIMTWKYCINKPFTIDRWASNVLYLLL